MQHLAEDEDLSQLNNTTVASLSGNTTTAPVVGGAEPTVDDCVYADDDGEAKKDEDGCLILETEEDLSPHPPSRSAGPPRAGGRADDHGAAASSRGEGGADGSHSAAAALRQVAEAAAAYTRTAFASCHDPLCATAEDSGDGASGGSNNNTRDNTSTNSTVLRAGRGAWPLFGDLLPFSNNPCDFKPKKGKRVYPVEDPTTPCYAYMVAPSPLPHLAPSLRLLSVFTEEINSVRVPPDTLRLTVTKHITNHNKTNNTHTNTSVAVGAALDGGGPSPYPSAPSSAAAVPSVSFASERLMRALVWFAALKANGVKFSPSADGSSSSSTSAAARGGGSASSKKVKRPWNIFWGNRIKEDARLKMLLPFQRVNHLPGTWEMGRKDTLALHLRRAQQKHGNGHYGFAPQSYLLPQDLPLLRRDAAAGSSGSGSGSGADGAPPTFILKPPASACGRGIRLFRGPNIPSDLLQASSDKRAFNAGVNGGAAGGPANNATKDAGRKGAANKKGSAAGTPADSSDDESDGGGSSSDDSSEGDGEEADDGAPDVPLVQRYIHNPLLINRHKFDLRIYVVCTSFEPFSLFIYNEGLVRFAAHSYGSDDLKDVARHLTNYSINKKSKDYVRAGGANANAAATANDREGEAEAEGERMASKWSLHQLKRYFENQRALYLSSNPSVAEAVRAREERRRNGGNAAPKKRSTKQKDGDDPIAAVSNSAVAGAADEDDVVLSTSGDGDDDPFASALKKSATIASNPPPTPRAGSGRTKAVSASSPRAAAASTTPRGAKRSSSVAAGGGKKKAPAEDDGADDADNDGGDFDGCDDTADADITWDWQEAWRRIKAVVIKTFLACLPSMVSEMTTRGGVKTRFGCFELYGFDVMLTDTFEAKLIEVNAMPSLQADSALDKHIKGQLLADCITLVGVPVDVNVKVEGSSSSSSSSSPSPPAGVAVYPPSLVDGNNVAWRPQPKGMDPRSICFWAGYPSAPSASSGSSGSLGRDGILTRGGSLPDPSSTIISDECKAVLALREDQLRRRGGFDALYPTNRSLREYGLFVGASSTTASDNTSSTIRFYDLLLAEWERRKEIVAANGGEEQLRLWLQGKAPFPASLATNSTLERKQLKAAMSAKGAGGAMRAPSVGPSTMGTARPRSGSKGPSTPPPSSSSSSALPPIATLQRGGSGGIPKPPSRSTSSTASRLPKINSSSSVKSGGANTLATTATTKRSASPSVSVKPRSPPPPPSSTSSGAVAGSSTTARRSTSITASSRYAANNVAQAAPRTVTASATEPANLAVQTLTFDAPPSRNPVAGRR